MKKFLLITLAVLLTLSFCACSRESEVTVVDGMKVAGKAAGNEAVHYSFNYPEEWELSENNGVIAIRYDCNPSDTLAEYASINVIAFSLQGSDIVYAKDYWNEYEADIKEVLNNYKKLDEEELKLDEYPALKVKYSAEMNERVYIFEQILCSTGSDIYIITLTADEGDFETASPALKTVSDSFKFE